MTISLDSLLKCDRFDLGLLISSKMGFFTHIWFPNLLTWGTLNSLGEILKFAEMPEFFVVETSFSFLLYIDLENAFWFAFLLNIGFRARWLCSIISLFLMIVLTIILVYLLFRYCSISSLDELSSESRLLAALYSFSEPGLTIFKLKLWDSFSSDCARNLLDLWIICWRPLFSIKFDNLLQHLQFWYPGCKLLMIFHVRSILTELNIGLAERQFRVIEFFQILIHQFSHLWC